MRRTLTTVAALIVSLIFMGTAHAGTYTKTFNLRFPAKANVDKVFNRYIDIAPNQRITSVAVNFDGTKIPKGLKTDWIVGCVHRGPAFFHWTWIQEGNSVNVYGDLIGGMCKPGPTVDGKVAHMKVTIKTTPVAVTPAPVPAPPVVTTPAWVIPDGYTLWNGPGSHSAGNVAYQYASCTADIPGWHCFALNAVVQHPCDLFVNIIYTDDAGNYVADDIDEINAVPANYPVILHGETYNENATKYRITSFDCFTP